jgi:hypothetical protein
MNVLKSTTSVAVRGGVLGSRWVGKACTKRAADTRETRAEQKVFIVNKGF